jgi:hypothetical protein
VTKETSTRPSRTASKVPWGADGCFGSIVNLTRPLVAFSTFCAQTASTSRVSECVGGTQLDIVMVVWAEAPAPMPARTMAAASEAMMRNDFM